MRKIVSTESETQKDNSCCLNSDDRLFLDALKDYHRTKKYKYMAAWLKGENVESSDTVARSG